MKLDDIVQAFSEMTPEDLKETCGRLARVFANKAEDIYDRDPENNGEVAQPYADISDLMAEASEVFEEPEGQQPVDDAEVSANTEPRVPTLSEVTARKSNPWGGR